MVRPSFIIVPAPRKPIPTTMLDAILEGSAHPKYFKELNRSNGDKC